MMDRVFFSSLGTDVTNAHGNISFEAAASGLSMGSAHAERKEGEVAEKTTQHTKRGPDDKENPYEQERMKRIRRNEEMLRQMGLKDTMDTFTRGSLGGEEGEGMDGTRSSSERRHSRTTAKKQLTSNAPLRKSNRLRVTSGSENSNEEITRGDHDAGSPLAAGNVEDELLDIEDYFKLVGKDITGALRVDGMYRGWVCPKVAAMYHVPTEGAKLPPETPIVSKADAKVRGWSSIRAKSAKMLRTNPNAYFYRHVAPDKHQAQGEWTEEEDALFMEIARREGVGDRWGLFASHIGSRVGYQCSAYYAQVVIPSGRIVDPRFKMTRSGKAVFCR